MLRGLGTVIALPALEAMMPRLAFTATTATAAAAGPKRLAWIYVPNGVDMTSWKPTTFGANYQLSPTLQGLAAFKNKMLVASGLTCNKANANGDGPGDHARANASYLTGVQATKSQGAGIHLGISVDQAAATKVGLLTRFPSLEIGMEQGGSGSCDNGYSCAYQHNLAWRSSTTPVAKECNPQAVFDRLFGSNSPSETAQARALANQKQKSILDFVLTDARSRQTKVGSADQQKLDEYFTSIREIETRLAKSSVEAPVKIPADAVRPPALPAKGGTNTYDTRLPLMLDMMVLAFQADLTRIITFPFADEGSNQTYGFADAPVPHHSTSHHMNDPVKIALLDKINAYHIKNFADLLTKLDKIKEGPNSILDNSLIAYGCGISDGNKHNHNNLPLILLGKGGGGVATGQHIQYNNVPINNMWLGMLDHIGAHWDSVGDSTGRISLA
jgi:hypothetical protein